MIVKELKELIEAAEINDDDEIVVTTQNGRKVVATATHDCNIDGCVLNMQLDSDAHL